jgi:hypothetical protein
MHTQLPSLLLSLMVLKFPALQTSNQQLDLGVIYNLNSNTFRFRESEPWREPNPAAHVADVSYRVRLSASCKGSLGMLV